ncbi:MULTISPECIES: DUF1611 domain-containing protein [unclassified Leptolyngbya]|uniref:DUF1611 domain-containing protein n=1 Tax=unclassified Leptolyngbya TaxID=2650499 RepID=UPI00168951AC|nr:MULTISPECIES: DUF1611 domain-containing protein [unclassified Leptolyngbya]MBD1913110.1 DUF1611 domain-containing protein [Leptolyngbya sp. FACHB-8]MBD2157805.1 DUF1611 domain-containing protein [Leptolyngbya sp. FACHB-16]
MLSSGDRVAILLHGGTTTNRGKTGISLLRYSNLPIVAVIDQDCAGEDLTQLTGIDRPIPIVASVADALAYGPTVLSIGIAPSGGALPDAWRAELKQALEAGLSIVNGLHTRMAQEPDLKAALQPDRWIWDVRQEPTGLTVGSGKARSLPCRRVLTVGTDMSVGKMSTSLELHRACSEQGMRSRFIATGQTGLMLGEDGIPLDAVRVDYAAGAVEQMVMKYGHEHDILHIEGQGSFMNPASTATLPLIRGSQPTHLILVHRAGQTHIHSFPDFQIPSLPAAIQVYETIAAAGGTFAPTKVVGIALNTFHLDDETAQKAIAQTQAEIGLPCTDVIRYGAAPLLKAIL